MSSYLFSSESVSDGHPDKICDQVSDYLLDLYLSHDPKAHVAIECMVFTNHIIVAGEVASQTFLEQDILEKTVRKCIKDIGYRQKGFHFETVRIDFFLRQQSPDIALGILNDKDGAGDQGIMFGYACDETDVYMPAPIYYANQLLKFVKQAREENRIKGFEPDAKSQITFHYENDRPTKIHSIVLSIHHQESVTNYTEILKPLIHEALPSSFLSPETKTYINPTGRFVIGGPESDTGITGRKIIVDTYGGAAPHGGGAFSGKDPTKVDRSAAYMARYLAKNIVHAGLAKKCTIQIAYAIGINYPLSIYVDTHLTGKVSNEELAAFIYKNFDLSPKGIRTFLGLNKPIYGITASFGHFGRTPQEDGSFSWEKLDPHLFTL